MFLRGSEWLCVCVCVGGGGGGGGVPPVDCRLKFSYFVGSWLKFSIFVGCR